MKITEHIPPVQFKKLFFALQNTITKVAGSLLICGVSATKPACLYY